MEKKNAGRDNNLEQYVLFQKGDAAVREEKYNAACSLPEPAARKFQHGSQKITLITKTDMYFYFSFQIFYSYFDTVT